MNRKELGKFSKTINDLLDYFVNKGQYAARTIQGFKYCYRRLQTVMLENNISEVNRENQDLLLEKAKPKSTVHNEFRTAIRHLIEFQETGAVLATRQFIKKRKVEFKGEIGRHIVNFIKQCKDEERLSISRINFLENNLMVFNSFCLSKEIKIFSIQAILTFLKEHKFETARQPEYCIGSLIRFTKFMKKSGVITNDFTDRIPRFRTVQQPKLPSVFKPEEIKKILEAIDLTSHRGKRDYAVVILAASLGLRATDIMALRLDSINWKDRVIEFDQVKTGNRLRLPLLPEVSKALSEYIAVRRESTDPHVFLLTLPPFSKITHGTVSHIFEQAIIKSGVTLGERKIGTRVFRSSLASHLLAQKFGVNVIASILGHQTLSVSKHYLRIDIENLKHCIQESLPLDNKFYTSNGFIA